MAKPKHAGNNYNHANRVPSPALLSALALIAPTVAGGPLPLTTSPPSFLCPFIGIDLSPRSLPLPPAPRAAISSNSTPTPTSTPFPSSSSSPTPSVRFEGVADRYVQGSDSLWRKTDSWTLFGLTCCSSSSASSSQPQPSSSQTSMPSSTPTSEEFDTSVLPAGWDTTTNPASSTESTIILALAIALAGSICVFMIGCVFWRRRKKRTKDIERKLGLGADDESHDNDREKDARGRMRIWARASARWKSNIRQSARRRRKKPVASSTTDRPLSPTSPQSSRRDSFVPEELSRPEQVSCSDGNEQPTAPHDPPRAASPPIYRAPFVPGSQPSFTDNEPIPYTPPNDGHVATDDKAQLARLRELASSPPITTDATSTSTVQSVSAPAWHEVEDDLGIDLSAVGMSCYDFDFPPSFPPPPTKTNLPFGYLDDHTLYYGEGDPLPIPGPSGFSPGALPSAPPMDEPSLVPSAPPLEDDELFQDWGSDSFPFSEALTSADLDCTPACVMESSMTPSRSDPSRREPATILPRYHP